MAGLPNTLDEPKTPVVKPARDKSYSLGVFVCDRLPFIIVAVAAIVLAVIILTVVRTSLAAVCLVSLILVGCAFGCFAYDYTRQARFWRELEDLTTRLDGVGYFTDIAPEPVTPEGQVAFGAVAGLSHLASEQIGMLRESASANAEYVNLWVHEVKMPVATLKLLANRLDGEESLELNREVERIEHQVTQALYAARANTLTSDYLIREIDLGAVVREACKQNMHLLVGQDASVEVDIPAGLSVFADEAWVSFIVSQIVGNAAKYDATHIAVTVQEPSEESPYAATTLQIVDNGCGIPAQDVPRVFERGFTGEVGRKHGSATGMGLYLVARMCAAMGLSVTLASEEGTGTRVLIAFPHDRRRLNLTSR